MRKNWNCTFIVVVFSVVLAAIPSIATPPPTGSAPIAPPTGGFDIDGDLIANLPRLNRGDWTLNTNAPGSGLGVLGASGLPLEPIRTFHFVDAYNDTADNIFNGGAKWVDNPNTWGWTSGKPSSKTDINNVLFHLSSDTNGHVWVVIAADRLSTAGDSYIDFEFLQSPLTLNGNGTITSIGLNGGRSTNDILLSVGFTGGGKTADFFAWRWQTSGSGFAYADVTTNLPVGSVFVAMNTNTTPAPYSAFGQMSYAPNAFGEAAVDLTALLGNFDSCMSVGFKTIMVKTKASASSSASIEDFISPIQFNLNIGPGANAGFDQVHCSEGTETAFPLQGVASSGLQAISNISWTAVSGNAIIDNPTNLTTTARVSTSNATLRLTVTQVNGCVKSDDVLLTVQSSPTCAIVGVTNTCPRMTNTFSAPLGMNSYLWTVVGNGSISGPTNQSTVKVVAGSACGTNYTLALAMTSNVCAISCSAEVAVLDTAAPVLSCPPDLNLDCPALTTTNLTGVATATDSCSRATVTYSDSETNDCGATKTIARTWTATDECGNSVSCVQAITVRDINPPVITCPANRTLEFPANTDPANTGVATATDACSSTTVTFNDLITTNCGNSLVISRTWTAIDQCSNNASCTQTITVRDTTAPVIVCPTNLTLETPAVTTTNVTGIATATDAGGSFTITHSDTTTTNCGNTFTISRRWTATDLCNNSSSCTQTIAVRDTTAPVIACPIGLALQCPTSTTTNATGVATATDVGSSVSITFVDSTTNGCGGTPTIARLWTATDLCGNSSACTQMIVVRDTNAPVIICPPNVTLEYPAVITTNVTGVATATDACGSFTITYADTTTTNCGNTFTISRRWTAIDQCNNSSSCTQTITVRDTIAPVISCPDSITFDCPAVTTTNATGMATATDVGSAIYISFVDSTTNGCGNTKIITRRWTATDLCGNSSGCTQTITVRDTVPPVITCPPSITIDCGASTLPVATGTATAVDTCNTVTVTFSDATTNLCGGTKIITRTWSATDTCNNKSSCNQTITVRDITPPALTLPSNRVLQCPGDTRTNMTGVATAVDGCGSVSISYSDVVSNSCGATRTVLRLWTATDQCGNTTNRIQTISVVDTQKPTIICPTVAVQCVDDVTVGYTSLAAFLAAGGTASDNCDSELTFSMTSAGSMVGSCPGTITRVYRVTDDCGNFSEGIQTIIVDDTIAPILICPPSLTVQGGESLDPATIGRASATDNCDTSVLVAFTDAAVPSTFNLNWYAADPVQNSAPYLPSYLKLGPANLPRPLGGRAADPLRNAVAYGPTSSQLDALTSLAGEPMSLGQVVPFEAVIEASGGTGPEHGTIEFTTSWSTHTTANDEFGFDKNYKVYCAFVDTADLGSVDPHNNAKVDSFSSVLVNTGTIDEKIQGTFRVSGLDSGDRVIVEIWVVLMSTQPDHVGGTIASDLVSAQKVLTPPQNISIGAKTISIGSLNKMNALPQPQAQPPLPTQPPQEPPPSGRLVNVINRTWTAADRCDNRSTCVQQITVRDATPPTISAPVDLVLECPADTRTNATGIASAQDACGGVRVIYSDTFSNGSGGSQIISRLWTASDEWGNSTNAVQTITVRDTTAPVLTCPPNVTLEAPAVTTTNITGIATAIDACGSFAITYSDTISTNCGNTFTISRRWTATDQCNNSSSCTQTIIVRDTIAPVLSCPASVTLDCPAITTTNVTGLATATDAGYASITFVDLTTNGCGGSATISRRWTATDLCGNSSSCTQTITVRDTKPPTISLVANKTITAGATLVFDTPTASDTCDTATVNVVSTTTNNLSPEVYTVTRTWMATDACGNISANRSQTITVQSPAPLKLTLTKAANSGLLLRWPANASEYRLECADNPAARRWYPVAITPVVTNGECRVYVEANGPGMFYRLANTPPILEVLKMGGSSLHLTWPTAPSGFRLESSDTPTSDSWTPETITPSVSNTLHHVLMPTDRSKKFFRLRK